MTDRPALHLQDHVKVTTRTLYNVEGKQKEHPEPHVLPHIRLD